MRVSVEWSNEEPIRRSGSITAVFHWTGLFMVFHKAQFWVPSCSGCMRPFGHMTPLTDVSDHWFTAGSLSQFSLFNWNQYADQDLSGGQTLVPNISLFFSLLQLIVTDQPTQILMYLQRADIGRLIDWAPILKDWWRPRAEVHWSDSKAVLYTTKCCRRFHLWSNDSTFWDQLPGN